VPQREPRDPCPHQDHDRRQANQRRALYGRYCHHPGRQDRVRRAHAVAESNPGAVIPIHVATNTAGKPIKVGLGPEQIAITPDGKMAYVTNLGSGTVTPIQVAAGTAGKAIKVGKAPFHLAITPDGPTVYVVNSILPLPGARAPGSVTRIRVAAGTAGKPIRLGRFQLGIAIDP